MPPFVQDALQLTADQKKQVEALQQEVDARLDKILTADQKKKLEMFGPPRGPGDRPPPDRPPQDRPRDRPEKDRPPEKDR